MIASQRWNGHLVAMKFADIKQKALALADRERASLAAKLLETLPAADTEVPHAEVDRREQELESGQVNSISHEEFIRRVRRELGYGRGMGLRRQ